MCLDVFWQQYRYKEMTVREITNVISQYKDLKPVMDSYGKVVPIRCLLVSLWSVDFLFILWNEY